MEHFGFGGAGMQPALAPCAPAGVHRAGAWPPVPGMAALGLGVVRSLLLLLVLWLGGALPALAQAGGYDQGSTTFSLRGKHEDVSCENCHLRGIFKGTPRDCATCHAQNNVRGAVSMPVRHIQTVQDCDACHTVNTFAGAIFSHVGVMPGTCASCHDSVHAQG
jgi:hypothetical protein